MYCAHAAGVSREGTKCIRQAAIMQANLVNSLHIKSTGFHEVLHHGQLTFLGCKVQGCVSIIIRVKKVALHLGGKVLSNGKMSAHSTYVKGIESILHWTIGIGLQPISTCTHTQSGPWTSNYTSTTCNVPCVQWYMWHDNIMEIVHVSSFCFRPHVNTYWFLML